MTYRTFHLLGLCVVMLVTGPQALAASPPATRPSVEVRTQQLAESWKTKLAAEKMSLLVASPFVIAGDGTPARLSAYRDSTILPAMRALNAQYFKTPIDEPILILLFEAEGPYKRLSKEWFKEEDVSPFGYYLHGDRTMLMNVGTGTGTLVHELVHALIAPDFPDVPDWFNEGLASLYEQSQFGANGKEIRGLINWRLPALQTALKDGTLRSTADLAKEPNFREPAQVRLNYAQARYLMLYLQEQKLLGRFYAEFKANHKDDPSGVKTLQKLIAPQSLEAFDKQWRAWAAGLKA